MKLYDLIGVLPEKTTIGNTEAEIADLEINSKLVREDSLFICLNGTAFDSHSCLSDLEAYACAAIVCERKLETKIPQIIVPDSRAAMSLLAAQFYGNPAKKLKLIAVSGTERQDDHLSYSAQYPRVCRQKGWRNRHAGRILRRCVFRAGAYDARSYPPAEDLSGHGGCRRGVCGHGSVRACDLSQKAGRTVF